VVATNLRHVVGPEVSAAQLDLLVGRAFSSYARYWAEAATLRALPASDPTDPEVSSGREASSGRDVSRGIHHLFEAIDRGRGVILALPHLGSWEYGAVWIGARGVPLTTVAELLEPPELYEWFVEQRAQLGLTVLPLGAHASTELLKVLRGGGVVALLADRDIAGDGVDVEFFGSRTKIPGGPATLALRTGAALLACAIYMRPGGGHLIVVRPPIDAERRGKLREDIARTSQALAHELEALIAAAPEQWHVFQPNWPDEHTARIDDNVE